MVLVTGPFCSGKKTFVREWKGWTQEQLAKHAVWDVQKLAEQAPHARRVLADVGVYLTVGAIQIVLGNDGISAMTWTGEINHIQIIFYNGTIQMGINKVLPGTGAPMAHNGTFDVLLFQRLPKKRVIQQIQLACG